MSLNRLGQESKSFLVHRNNCCLHNSNNCCTHPEGSVLRLVVVLSIVINLACKTKRQYHA